MMLGASRETLLRNPFTRCLVAGDQDTFYLMRKKLISDRSAQSCDVRLATSDGALVWVNLSATGAEDENGAPTMRIVMSDITERIYLRDALHLSLREKESMLGVIHQRVSSNLQVIDSMLRLEERRTEQSETQSVLADLQKRIRSIALVHRTLHRTGMFTNLDLGAYLKKLATESFSYPANVQLRLNLASLHLNMDQVVAAGLIVNELLNNCLAHAFPEGRAGEIAIELQPVDQTDHWRLCVSDTGAGLPEHFQPAKNPLGLQLVADLAMQLGGKLEIGPRPAAIFNIIFSARTGNS